MIELDGSESHGGGSILRLATGFSVLTNTPMRIKNIRAGRPSPGIREQHLAGLRALNSLCEGSMRGDEIGSTELEFFPGVIGKSTAEIPIATAGSVGLVLQPILIASLSSRHAITLKIKGGGTMGKWAPPFNYMQNVTFRILEKMGFEIYSEVFREGFYPRGGADVSIEIKPPSEIISLRIPEPGRALSVKGISVESSSLGAGRIAERQKYACQQILEKYFQGTSLVGEFETARAGSDSPGSCLTSWIEHENCVKGFGQVGEIGLRAEDIGKNVAENVIRLHESGSTLDECAADQIIPFMAFAGNSIATAPKMTGHMRTSIWLSETFLGKKINVDEGKNITIMT